MSENYNTATEKPDVYRKVTDAIESGIGQYWMPWSLRQDRRFSPISVDSPKVAA
jgi:hypothetical protein